MAEHPAATGSSVVRGAPVAPQCPVATPPQCPITATYLCPTDTKVTPAARSAWYSRRSLRVSSAEVDSSINTSLGCMGGWGGVGWGDWQVQEPSTSPHPCSFRDTTALAAPTLATDPLPPKSQALLPLATRQRRSSGTAQQHSSGALRFHRRTFHLPHSLSALPALSAAAHRVCKGDAHLGQNHARKCQALLLAQAQGGGPVRHCIQVAADAL